MSGFNSDGAGFGSQLLGMIGGHQQDRRNYRDQRNLMNLQMQNQAGLNRQGHDLLRIVTGKRIMVHKLDI